MTYKVDDDVVMAIQGFTTAMAAKGYHVVGCVISKTDNKTHLSTFATAPSAGEAGEKHLKNLVELMYLTVFSNKQPELHMDLPISEN